MKNKFDSAYSNFMLWNSDNRFDLYPYFDELIYFTGLNPNDINLLEIGFGDAAFLRYCGYKGINATGIEVNEHQIEKWRDKLNVYNYSHLELKIKYDLILIIDVLEHMSFDDSISLLTKLENVLAPNGKILIRVPNGDSPFGLVNFNSDPTHVSFFGSSVMKFLCAKSNLHVLKVSGELLPYRFGPIFSRLKNIIILIINFFINRVLSVLLKKPVSSGYMSCNSLYLLSKL